MVYSAPAPCTDWPVQSVKAFKTHINAYVKFCQKYKLLMFNSSVMQLRRYALELTDTHDSVDSIKNYVGGVRKLFALMNFPEPDIGDYVYGLTIKGITRDKGHVVRRAHPVTPDLLVSMYGKVNTQDIRHIVAWVAVLLGFYAFFRKSNLVPESAVRFDGDKQLSRKNFYKWEGMYFIRVFWAKNIQFRERELIIPLLPNPDKRICPVYWLDVMFELVPGNIGDPGLAIPGKSGNRALVYAQLTKLMRQWIDGTGLDPKLFTSHSLRRGGASWAAHCGIPSHVIKILGDWRSQAFLKYIELTLESKYDALMVFNMSMF